MATHSNVLQFRSVQSFSRVRLFATPWIAARQASLSITNSRSLPKPMSIELVMPSNHLILCRPLLLLPQSLPASRSFPMSQLFSWGGQSIGVSASISLPGKFHGQRSLVGYRPWGGKKSDTTDLLSTVIPAGTSLVVKWLRLRLPTQRVGVRSLVGELRSYMLCSQKTKTWNQNRSNIVTNSIKT